MSTLIQEKSLSSCLAYKGYPVATDSHQHLNQQRAITFSRPCATGSQDDLRSHNFRGGGRVREVNTTVVVVQGPRVLLKPYRSSGASRLTQPICMWSAAGDHPPPEAYGRPTATPLSSDAWADACMESDRQQVDIRTSRIMSRLLPCNAATLHPHSWMLDKMKIRLGSRQVAKPRPQKSACQSRFVHLAPHLAFQSTLQYCK